MHDNSQPLLKIQLLLVSKLIRDMHCAVIFLPGILIFNALWDERILRIGREDGRLYTWIEMTSELDKRTTAGTSTTFISPTNNLRDRKVHCNEELLSWHRRLGHFSFIHMLKLTSLLEQLLWNSMGRELYKKLLHLFNGQTNTIVFHP